MRGACSARGTRFRASTRIPRRTRAWRSVGTALEEEALTGAGIERADAFIASTDGDNTNIVVAQLAKRKFNVPTVIARILDPLRAEWYEKQGVNTICPTRIAIEMLEKEVLEAAGSTTGTR